MGHQIGAQEGWRDAQVARRGVWSGCSGECGFYGVQQAGFGVSGRGQRGFVRSSFSSAGAVCFFVCVRKIYNLNACRGWWLEGVLVRMCVCLFGSFGRLEAPRAPR